MLRSIIRYSIFSVLFAYSVAWSNQAPNQEKPKTKITDQQLDDKINADVIIYLKATEDIKKGDREALSTAESSLNESLIITQALLPHLAEEAGTLDEDMANWGETDLKNANTVKSVIARSLALNRLNKEISDLEKKPGNETGESKIKRTASLASKKAEKKAKEDALKPLEASISLSPRKRATAERSARLSHLTLISDEMVILREKIRAVLDIPPQPEQPQQKRQPSQPAGAADLAIHGWHSGRSYRAIRNEPSHSNTD